MRSLHLLQVPVIAQRTGFECGNTCLASVVQYLGRHYSPKDMRDLAGTNAEGTDHAEMIAGALKTGATVFAKSGGTTAEIAGFVARGLPVIAGWWSIEPGYVDWDPAWTLPQRKKNDCGHYSVVSGVTPGGFVFMDPQDGDDDQTIGICEKSEELWKRVWYDTDGAAYDRVRAWYMVINYDGRLFAGEHKGGVDHTPAK